MANMGTLIVAAGEKKVDQGPTSSILSNNTLVEEVELNTPVMMVHLLYGWWWGFVC